jgi:hypothetical protein
MRQWARSAGPKAKTSRPSARYRTYPYLLRGLPIGRTKHNAADITYIRVARGCRHVQAPGPSSAATRYAL